MTEQRYVTIDSTDVADIREGDRVTLDFQGHFSYDGFVATGPVKGLDGGKGVGPFVLLQYGAYVVKIERPVPTVAVELGAVYGLPGSSWCRVACVDTGDTRYPWIGTGPGGNPGWMSTEEVQPLVSALAHERLN